MDNPTELEIALAHMQYLIETPHKIDVGEINIGTECFGDNITYRRHLEGDKVKYGPTDKSLYIHDVLEVIKPSKYRYIKISIEAWFSFNGTSKRMTASVGDGKYELSYINGKIRVNCIAYNHQRLACPQPWWVDTIEEAFDKLYDGATSGEPIVK